MEVVEQQQQEQQQSKLAELETRIARLEKYVVKLLRRAEPSWHEKRSIPQADATEGKQ